MRRLIIGLVVTATTALVPMLAFADNQETAEQVAAQSGMAVIVAANDPPTYDVGVADGDLGS